MSRKNTQPIPNQVRRYRRQRNLRLRDVAKLTGHASAANLSNWEKGRKTPSLKNALKLAAAIGCPVEVLFFDFFQDIRHKVESRRSMDKQQKQK